IRSERSIFSLTLPHLEHLFVEGNQRSARSNVSPCHTVLYPICRRNSPRPTSLMERASLRLRFIPSTWRFSSTTRAGRTCALAAVACRSRCLICCCLTFRATCLGNEGISAGCIFLLFLRLTLAFGSGKEAAISALRAARSSGERAARVSRLVALCRASRRTWAMRAYLRASFMRALTRFLLPLVLRERRRCRRLRRVSSQRKALGFSTTRPSEHWASRLIPTSIPIGSDLPAGGSGTSSSTWTETNHRPASSETVAERTCTPLVGIYPHSLRRRRPKRGRSIACS